jgi:TRAP-type C4-dicarboxylate transport system permease small subunit
MLTLLARFEQRLGWLEDWAGIAAVAGLALVVNLQIFARYIFHAPFIWPEEIARLLLVWMTFIGSAAVARRAGDLAVDTFVEMMPRIPRRIFLVIRDVVMVVLFAFVAWQGLALARTVAGMPLAATGLSTELLAWPVLIGGLLIAFHAALRLLVLAADPGAADRHPLPKTLT